MATIAAVILAHQRRKDGTYPVRIRITHRGESRYLSTAIAAAGAQVTRGMKLKDAALRAAAEAQVTQMRGVLAKLSPFALEDMTVDDVVVWLRREMTGDRVRVDFFEHAEGYIARLGNEGSRSVYSVAVNALERYLGRRTLDAGDITAAMLREFSRYLESEPLYIWDVRERRSVPTRKAKPKGAVAVQYVQRLGTIYEDLRRRYNDEDEGFVPFPRQPFKRVGLKPRQAQGQRALPQEVVQEMIDDRDCRQRYALDIALLSFCLMGINMADMYRAKKPKDGVLEYERQKVEGRRAAVMRVPVPSCAEQYVRRVGATAKGSRWLGLATRWARKEGATQWVDANLKAWAKAKGHEPFTFYAMRHTWATLARSAKVGAAASVVDECLAHTGNFPLADIYAERDYEVYAEVNRKVLALFSWEWRDTSAATRTL